jgi:hypothetical protein
LATNVAESEFNFGLTIEDPDLPPFELGETVVLVQHALFLANQQGKEYAALCPIRTGKVYELQKPLLRNGTSFIARVRCDNDACGYKTILKR